MIQGIYTMQINIYFDNSENTADFDIVDEWLKKVELHDIIQTFWIDNHEDSEGIDDKYGLTVFPVMLSIGVPTIGDKHNGAKIYAEGVDAIIAADVDVLKADLAATLADVPVQTIGPSKE